MAPSWLVKYRSTVLAALAPAAAIFVFGVIYGSLARPLMDPFRTILSSLLIFSGSVQFTIVAFLSAGAGAGALVAGAMTLNLRNLVLGAVLRPRVQQSPARRAALGWFLTDEAAGLALASDDDATSILLISGGMFYLAWIVGTIVGVLGASVEGVRSIAESVFPVLFIGLAAVACTSRSIALRALIAAGLTAGIAFLWPGVAGVAAVVTAIGVALPGDER
jgi:predicted branched-subunit amino acid permease